MTPNVCPRTKLCVATPQFIFWPSADGYIPWALGVVLRCRQDSCHHTNEVNLDVPMDLLPLMRCGRHGFFPVAWNPLKGNNFGLEIVLHLGWKIHVNAFVVWFPVSTHGDSFVFDVLFVTIIGNGGPNDSPLYSALKDCCAQSLVQGCTRDSW